MKNILVIGSGGREHAFVKSLHEDQNVGQIFCAPGNGGTALISTNIGLDISNHQTVIEFAKQNNIDLTIVGPEAPLSEGIVDAFNAEGLRIFGPNKFASQLESSKLFARDVMKEYNIPQPEYYSCNTRDKAERVKEILELPIVLKADGLAAGKGVLVCHTEIEFNDAMKVMYDDAAFGEACNEVSVEKCLIGEELSVFAVCDGNDFVILNSAQDHKRAYDGDLGPNTGGMGAYSPTPLSTPDMISKVSQQIIKPTLDAMVDKGNPFVGFLYAGIMIVNKEPFVIEFNVRMGDPETQVVFPLLKSSLYELLSKATDGKLVEYNVEISTKTAVTVVLSAEGYPASYPKGMEIHGLENMDGDLVFHAGTQKKENGRIVTSGGRVLNVVGFGNNLVSAIQDAYRIVEKVDFSGKFYRKDIGQRGLKYLNEGKQ